MALPLDLLRLGSLQRDRAIELEQLDPLKVPQHFLDEVFIVLISIRLEVRERYRKALRVSLR